MPHDPHRSQGMEGELNWVVELVREQSYKVR
jgi:hypothetical protein